MQKSVSLKDIVTLKDMLWEYFTRITLDISESLTLRVSFDCLTNGLFVILSSLPVLPPAFIPGKNK